MSNKPASPWRAMWVGMRPYGVSITVMWAACASTVLVVLAVAVPGAWAHVAFGAGALLELGLSFATLRYLKRASLRGRFDV